MKHQQWQMPEWMKPYCALFVNTGREPTVEAIEELYNGRTDPIINLPLSTIEACVKSQVLILRALHDNKLLNTKTTDPFSAKMWACGPKDKVSSGAFTEGPTKYRKNLTPNDDEIVVGMNEDGKIVVAFDHKGRHIKLPKATLGGLLKLNRHVWIEYTNHRGERKVVEIRPMSVAFGSNGWHKEPQWLLTAIDVERNVTRYYAIANIHAWHKTAPENADDKE